MRLPLGSRALRRRSRLLHPVYRRAPLDRTAGLRNPVSCAPVRERGDKVFGERSTATAGFNIDTEADDYFPNDDFFPDISNLFDDMALQQRQRQRWFLFWTKLKLFSPFFSLAWSFDRPGP
nr:uncharacterized protein LOC127305803 [Lolium perenne]